MSELTWETRGFKWANVKLIPEPDIELMLIPKAASSCWILHRDGKRYAHIFFDTKEAGEAQPWLMERCWSECACRVCSRRVKHLGYFCMVHELILKDGEKPDDLIRQAWEKKDGIGAGRITGLLRFSCNTTYTLMMYRVARAVGLRVSEVTPEWDQLLAEADAADSRR